MFRVPNQYRIRTHPQLGSEDSIGNKGAFQIPYLGITTLFCIADDGVLNDNGVPLPPEHSWEHVSVSAREHLTVRTPTWDEMVYVKNRFWDREDCVLEFHPPRSEYVNVHPHVLHLWRLRNFNQPRPPTWMIG